MTTLSKNRLGIPAYVWIAGVAFLAAAPILLFGNAWGYDFDFHTSMWMDAGQQFRQGILLPRWAAGVYAGFGEPSLIFYPPLSWIAGGLLGLIVGWKFAACAFVVLSLALAGGGMWKLARIWMEPRDALVACLLYMLNPYMLVNVYKRSDYGELLAGALFPMLVRAAIRISQDGRRTILPLVAIFASLWLADLPEAMVASYSLALLLVLGSLLNRSPRSALAGSVAIVAAFACLTFFLLPAMWERPWVEIGLVFRPDWTPENNFLFTPSIDPIMSLYGRWISYVAVFFIVTTASAAALGRQFRLKRPQIFYLLAALGGASAFLLFRPSWIVWQIMPALRYVEYPSRWLTPLAVVNALLMAAAIAESGREKLMRLAAVGGFAALGVAMLFTVRWDTGNRHMDAVIADMRSGGTGFRFTESKDWRLPLHSHPSKLPDFAPLVAPSGDDRGVRIDVQRWAPERKVFSVVSPQPTLLKIKLLNYPAWRAKLNGRDVPLQTDTDTGQMLLPAGPGVTQAEIVFTRTADRTAGMIVSFLSVLILGALGWYYRRSGNPESPVGGAL